METFDGLLDGCALRNTRLDLRFVSGDFDPAPAMPQVWQVRVHRPADAVALVEQLQLLCEEEDNVYIERLSDTELALHPDHGERLSVRGRRVEVRATPYGPRDYERLARLNFERARTLDRALAAGRAQLARARQLLREQAQQLGAALQRPSDEAAKYALLGQQHAFLTRLLEVVGD